MNGRGYATEAVDTLNIVFFFDVTNATDRASVRCVFTGEMGGDNDLLRRTCVISVGRS